MNDVTKDVLGDLIKYLRGLEIRDENPDEKTVDDTKMVGREVAPDAFGDREDELKLDPMMDLEEPDLDVPDDEGDGLELTEKQKEIKDFFNNRRPKRGTDRQSRTFMAEAKVNGRPVAEVIKKSKK